MSKATILKLVYGSVVALLLTFSATAAFAQDGEPEATSTVAQPATFTPVPVVDTPTPVPTNTPVPPTATLVPTPIPPTPIPPTPEVPVQIPEPITVVLFGTGLAALSASVSKRRKSQ